MFSKYPFLLPVFGCILGIYIQDRIGGTFLFILSLILLIIIATTILLLRLDQLRQLKLWLQLGIFLFSAILIGAITTEFKQIQSKDNIIANLKIEQYKGYIKDIGKTKYGNTRTIVEIGVPHKQDILCYFKVNTRSKQLHVGDSITFNAKLTKINNLSSGGNFDYEKYMYHRDILYKVKLYGDDWYKNGNHNKSLYRYSQEIRAKLIDYFANDLKIEGESLGLVSALLLGAQDDISEELTDAFIKSGTVHVLSVSGLHVSLIYSFFIFIITLIPILNRKKILVNILIIVFLIFFAFLTGLNPSVLRASMMLILLCIANLIGKNPNSLNNLFSVGFFMLVYNPFILYNIGFQLSFMAVFFILVLYPMVRNKFESKYKTLNAIKDLFLLTVVAQLGTFPLILYYFGSIPTYFFIANLVIVPLANVLILGIITNAIFTFIVSLIPLLPIVSIFLDAFHTYFNKAIEMFIAVVYFFSKIPFASIDNFYFRQVEVILSYIILFLCISYLNNKRHYYQLYLILACIFIILGINFYLITGNNNTFVS